MQNLNMYFVFIVPKQKYKVQNVAIVYEKLYNNSIAKGNIEKVKVVNL